MDKIWFEGVVGIVGLLVAYILVNLLKVEHPTYIFSFGFITGFLASYCVKFFRKLSQKRKYEFHHYCEPEMKEKIKL